MQILRASVRLGAYDNGYSNTVSLRTITRWSDITMDQITNSLPSTAIARSNYKGSADILESIKSNIQEIYILFFEQRLI